jgi:hypothetical protein
MDSLAFSPGCGSRCRISPIGVAASQSGSSKIPSMMIGDAEREMMAFVASSVALRTPSPDAFVSEGRQQQTSSTSEVQRLSGVAGGIQAMCHGKLASGQTCAVTFVVRGFTCRIGGGRSECVDREIRQRKERGTDWLVGSSHRCSGHDADANGPQRS